jgi:hypothetical protein
VRRRRSPTRRLRQNCTQSARGGVRTCLASRVGACFGPRPAAPLADLANFEGAAHCSSSGASASVLVGQMASSVAVVSVISAENLSIDWATRMAATRRLWCTIHGSPRAREPQSGRASRTKPAFTHHTTQSYPRLQVTWYLGNAATSSDQLVRSCCVADSWPLTQSDSPPPRGARSGSTFQLPISSELTSDSPCRDARRKNPQTKSRILRYRGCNQPENGRHRQREAVRARMVEFRLSFVFLSGALGGQVWMCAGGGYKNLSLTV